MSGQRRIYLMRHGEPALTGRMLGRTDCPATPAGTAACRAAAATLGEVAAIISSDLSRATACAEAAGDMLALPVVVDPRWRELDFGAWDGCRPDEIDPDALARFWANPDADPPPGGERWSSLRSRIAAALSVAENDALIVTHAGAMRAALDVACGFGVRQIWAVDLPYAAILTLSLWRDDEADAPLFGQIVGLRG